MRPCWVEKSLTKREARLLEEEEVGERAAMAGPLGDSAEDGPGGSGRRPCYAVPKAEARIWPLSGQKAKMDIKFLLSRQMGE